MLRQSDLVQSIHQFGSTPVGTLSLSSPVHMAALVATTGALQLRPAQPLRSRTEQLSAVPLDAATASSARRRVALLPPSATVAQQPPAAQVQPLAAAALGCLAAALLAVSPGPAASKDVIQGVPKVVDGDTLDFSGTRVRLFGIDAPETKQSCTRSKGGDYLCGEASTDQIPAQPVTPILKWKQAGKGGQVERKLAGRGEQEQYGVGCQC